MYEGHSFSEKLFAAQACQKVEELKGRHAYLHATSNSREEYDVIWLKSGHTTFAHGFGRMCGWDQDVGFNSITHTDKMAILGNFTTINLFPEYEGHDLRTTGTHYHHALASSVIEVAENGKSARSFYCTPGILMGVIGRDYLHRGGDWLWERYGSDFVYVDGEWKWFHEQVCPDISGFYDNENWAYDSFVNYGKPPEPRAKSEVELEFEPSHFPARLTEPAPPGNSLHYDYSVTQVQQNTVPLPRKYECLCDEHTYSPGRNDPYVTDNARTPGASY